MNTDTLQLIQKLCFLDKKDLTQKTLKTCEEVGEMAQAVLSYTRAANCEYKNLQASDILSEAADVIICAHSVALQAGFQFSDIENEVKAKLDKWQSKINSAPKS